MQKSHIFKFFSILDFPFFTIGNFKIYRQKIPKRYRHILLFDFSYFGVLPVGNLKEGSLGEINFFALPAAKRIRALAANPKNRKNQNGRVKNLYFSSV